MKICIDGNPCGEGCGCSSPTRRLAEKIFGIVGTVDCSDSFDGITPQIESLIRAEMDKTNEACTRLQQEINCLRMEPCQLPHCIQAIAEAKKEAYSDAANEVNSYIYEKGLDIVSALREKAAE